MAHAPWEVLWDHVVSTATDTAMAPGATDRQPHWWLSAGRIRIPFRLRVQGAALDDQRAHFLDVEYSGARPGMLLLRQIPIQDLSYSCRPACRDGSRYPGLPVLPTGSPPATHSRRAWDSAGGGISPSLPRAPGQCRRLSSPQTMYTCSCWSAACSIRSSRCMSVMSSTPPTKPVEAGGLLNGIVHLRAAFRRLCQGGLDRLPAPLRGVQGPLAVVVKAVLPTLDLDGKTAKQVQPEGKVQLPALAAVAELVEAVPVDVQVLKGVEGPGLGGPLGVPTPGLGQTFPVSS